MDLTGKKVWFLGDSITEGVGTSCAEARFSEVLKKNANLGEIRNYGISATRIARQQGLGENADFVDLNSFVNALIRWKTAQMQSSCLAVPMTTDTEMPRLVRLKIEQWIPIVELCTT